MYVATRIYLKSRQKRRIKEETPGSDDDIFASGTLRNDLYLSLRPLLLFGHFIGMVPFSGLLQKNIRSVEFRKSSLRATFTAIVAVSLCSNIVVSMLRVVTVNHKTLPEVVWTSRPIIFHFIGIFGYWYMFMRGGILLDLLKQWQRMKYSFPAEDKHLRRDSLLIFVGVYTSAVLENALQQAIQMSLLDVSLAVILIVDTGMRFGVNGTTEVEEGIRRTPWEEYYMEHTQPKWSAVVPYNFWLSLLIFLWNKFCLYGWNFIDIFITILSRAIYFKFKMLASHTYEHVVKPLSDARQKIVVGGCNQWQAVTKDFETLYLFLDGAKKFLSPLVFTSYGTNLYFVIIHLHMGITPVRDSDSPAATDVYRTWAFTHIIVRMFLLTLNASRIADYSEEFIRLYRKCPTEFYSVKVRRTERFAKSTKCCITGLDCFYVTKPFMLSLIGVVFTFEIVLLQSSGFGSIWAISVPS